MKCSTTESRPTVSVQAEALAENLRDLKVRCVMFLVDFHMDATHVCCAGGEPQFAADSRRSTAGRKCFHRSCTPTALVSGFPCFSGFSPSVSHDRARWGSFSQNRHFDNGPQLTKRLRRLRDACQEPPGGKLGSSMTVSSRKALAVLLILFRAYDDRCCQTPLTSQLGIRSTQ